MADTPETDPWIGKYVIVRCRDAGVHAGTLKSHEGRQCELTGSRRLWRWQVADKKGVSLSDLAVAGIDTSRSKIGTEVDIILTENCEIIACTDQAAASISGATTYAPA